MEKYQPYTEEEWIKAGEMLYGPDNTNWKFRCPMCGNVQTVADFKQFKDKGATPDSVRQECIGRYMPRDQVTSAFGNKNPKVKSPCDYAAFGLFRIGHVIKLKNGETTVSFPFDRMEAPA